MMIIRREVRHRTLFMSCTSWEQLMSKLDQYYSTKKALEELSAQLEKLESDSELKKALEFQDKLQALMSEYKKDANDVMQALGIDSSAAKPAGKRAGGAKRAMKTYRNPQTGEVVKTRGGNHKVLNAWRAQFGKDKVDSWLQA